MAFPDDLEWNQPGVEPTQAKKDEGWKPEEKPPAEYFNWFFNRTSQAVKYLKGESDKLIDDAKIGNRTITDTTTAVTGAYTLTKLLSMLGNMIKRITGKSNWYTAPAMTLEDASNHTTATSAAHAASAISSTATGGVAATNVQAAIAELDSEKAPKGYGVGERLTPLASGYDLNTLLLSGMYIVPAPTNIPFTDLFQYGVIVTGGSMFTSQMLVRFESNKTLLYHRHTVNSGSAWSTWKQIATMDLVAPAGYGLGTTANNYTGDIDKTAWETGFYYVRITATGTKPYDYGHMIVMVESAAATIKQIWMTNITNDMQIRQCVNGVWSPWKKIATTDLITPYGLGTTTVQYLNADLNTMLTTGFFYVNGPTMTNYPSGADINAHLLVIARASTHLQQTYYAADGIIYTRICTAGTWSPWKQIATTDYFNYSTEITDTNWNTLTVNGKYYVVGTSALAINGPLPAGDVNHLFYVDVINGTSSRTTYVSQQATNVVTGILYTRKNQGGTWSAWKQIATADQTTYIAAYGSGTGYYWRKWSNGDIEIFGTAAAVVNTAGTVTFPITLASVKMCIAEQNEKGVPNGYVFRAINITTAKFDYQWDVFIGNGSGASCVIHYHVVGT
ncbi:MAG: hypothetical protein K0R78_3392 [Pelosinus sp.]|jgi:hypothetical protein|nr:hypothetical protein [Pelosinus sp.]